MKNLSLIAACSDLGIHIDGASLGPEILIRNLTDCDIIKVTNLIDIKKELSENNKKKNLKGINLFNSSLYSAVLSSLNNKKFPLILGGDHSISIGSALASIKEYNNLGIIWFDAHGDFNTFDTTISGNIHGLPLATLTNYEKNYLTDFHNGNYYNCKNAVIVGVRDLDELEEKNLKDAGITMFTTNDIKQYGFNAIYEKAFEIASNGTNGLHISYDLDIIDPILAPGVSVPVKKGINLEEANSFVDYIIKYKNIVKSMDIVEFNPLKDINKKTELIANSLINEILINFE